MAMQKQAAVEALSAQLWQTSNREKVKRELLIGTKKATISMHKSKLNKLVY